MGCLAVFAKYFPLIYPDSKIPVSQVEKSLVQEQSDADWVKIEPNADIYKDIEDGTANSPSKSPILTTSQVPPHSLAAYTLFLCLPGYSEVLLKDKGTMFIKTRIKCNGCW